MTIKKVALVIAHTEFQPVEYANTKKEIEAAGYHVLTVSDAPGLATATDGTRVPVDCTLEQVAVNELAGLFIIGGSGALDHLDHPTTHALLQNTNDANLPVGAICISVRILARADILAQKKATGWNGDNALNEIFQAHGATLLDAGVVVDDTCVTARGPADATQFGAQIVTLVREQERLDIESKRRY